MAKISTYPVDSTISDSDIVIGSDGDNAFATKNYTVGALSTYVQAPLKNQKVVGITPEITLIEGLRKTIIYNSVTGDPSTGSLNYNSSNGDITFDNVLGEFENTSGGDLVIRISTTTFTTVTGGGGGSRTVSYFLQHYTGSWADVKEVQRVKASDGEYADSFWAYFKLGNGEKFRIQMLTTTDTVTIGAGSQFEFDVQ